MFTGVGHTQVGLSPAGATYPEKSWSFIIARLPFICVLSVAEPAAQPMNVYFNPSKSAERARSDG